MKKRLFALFLAIAAILLSSCSEAPKEAPKEAPPQTHLLWLYKEEMGEDYFYGRDGEGKLWLVHGQHDSSWPCGWVRYTGEPTQGTDADYQITADAAWFMTPCDQADFGEAFDTCLYDHDGDGTAELCVISRYENSQAGQFELTVWDGAVCEAHTYFYGGGSMEALAFDWDDGNMVIRSVNWPYGAETWTIETYAVRWQKNGPVVSRRPNE